MKTVHLGEIVNIKTGKLDANAQDEKGIYPFFTCSREPLSINEYAYDCECVLVAGNGDLNVKYYEGKFNAYQRTYIIESKNKKILLPKYLYYFLDIYIEVIRNNSIGGVIKYIKLGNLTDISFPLLEINEQENIIAALDKITSLISKRKDQIALLNKLSKEMFVDMFGDPSTFQNSKDSVFLNSLGTFKNGMNYRNGDKGHRIKCLGVGDFKSKYNIFDVNMLSDIELEKEPSEEYLLRDNDIVFVRSNGNKALVGRCVLVYPQNNRLTFSGFCIRFRINDNRVLPEYLNHLLHLPSTRNALFESIRGCNIQNLNQKMLSSLKIHLPPIELQQQFIDNIQIIQNKSAQLESSLAELETTYKAALQKAFNGELF